jgi:hypothetical protein
MSLIRTTPCPSTFAFLQYEPTSLPSPNYPPLTDMAQAPQITEKDHVTNHPSTVLSQPNHKCTRDIDEPRKEVVVNINGSKLDWKQACLLWICFPTQRKPRQKSSRSQDSRRPSCPNSLSTTAEPQRGSNSMFQHVEIQFEW